MKHTVGYKLSIKIEFDIELGIKHKNIHVQEKNVHAHLCTCVKAPVKIIIWVIKLVPCSNYMINQPCLISTA